MNLVSSYAAKVTRKSLGTLFEKATTIQSWLSDAAREVGRNGGTALDANGAPRGDVVQCAPLLTAALLTALARAGLLLVQVA